MAIMNTFAMFLAQTTPQLDHFIGKFLLILQNGIGNFGWTVVVFTLIIKLILSPLDLWQKQAQRKQSRSMARVQPQLLKLQEKYANKPDVLKQKQMELYRKEKIGIGSTIGMCLPMIVTMVIFIVILAGFNAMVRYQNELIIFNIADKYNAAIAAGTPLTDAQLAALYTPEKWLWVHNIFMPDNWSSIIPSFENYAGSGIGSLNALIPPNANIPDWYNTLVGPAQAANEGWNGYLVLPLLCMVLSVLQTKVMQSIGGKKKDPSEMTDQEKKTQKTTKTMMIVMPIVMGIFSIFYSAAFALYILTSSVFSFIFGVIYNLVTRAIDNKRAAITVVD